MNVEPARARQRGFTLTQLLTTLAVALTLLSVGIPSWHQVIASNAVAAAGNRMASILALGRSTAVYRHTYTTLCTTSDGRHCSNDHTAWHKGYMLFVDANGDRQHDAGEQILRMSDPSRNNTLIYSSSGRPSIRFRSDGSAWGSNVTLRVCSATSPKNNRALILYGSGRVRLSATLADGSPVICEG